MNTKKALALALVALIMLAAAGYVYRNQLNRLLFRPTEYSTQDGVSNDLLDDTSQSKIESVAENLSIPWAVSFLPDGDMLVTERTGTLKRLSDGQDFIIDGVKHTGEGGLLGLALHPNFESNNWLYLYMTTETTEGLVNRVERYDYNADKLNNRKVVLGNIPGARYHDGGRLAFGPDELLYITTGDAGNEALAQDTNSLAGKILRLADTGDIPDSNPFGNAVYSYGHRNPQGLAWDSKNRLWSTEHGPSGIQSGYDELNLIEAGGNYGWPIIRGEATQTGMISPVIQSGPDETWAPASLAYHEGSLYFGGLRGESIYQAVIRDDDSVTLSAHFRGDYGRFRTVMVGSDNIIYVTTSNTDGRGSPRGGDDKLIKIDPAIFHNI